ncbi:MAG: DUF3450 domain-containing protein [Pseudomonadales bacterium]|nr:DUF3450 domain-containing protein [Pseudomonadales bacterium]
MMRDRQNFKLMRGAARVAIAALLGGACSLAIAEDAGARYARLVADSESLASYNTLIESQIKFQQQRLIATESQLAGLDATGADINGLIRRMYDELVKFHTTDLPFIDPVSDRNERMERLRNLMDNDGSSAAERYRRLLEAYQIEIEYGRNLETYNAKLEDGRDADFVRVGRVALLYRTADGSETGYWDKNQNKWIVDQSYESAVLYALRIAKKEIAPDLIAVPVPAAQEVRS